MLWGKRGIRGADAGAMAMGWAEREPVATGDCCNDTGSVASGTGDRCGGARVGRPSLRASASLAWMLPKNAACSPLDRCLSTPLPLPTELISFTHHQVGRIRTRMGTGIPLQTTYGRGRRNHLASLRRSKMRWIRLGRLSGRGRDCSEGGGWTRGVCNTAPAR